MYFTAEWCKPCQTIAPVVSSDIENGAPIEKVDVDARPTISEQYNVLSIPTFVMIRDGKEIGRFSGTQNYGQVREWMTLQN